MQYFVNGKIVNAPEIAGIGWAGALVTAGRWVSSMFGADIAIWAFRSLVGSTKTDTKLSNQKIYSSGSVKRQTTGTDGIYTTTQRDYIGIATGKIVVESISREIYFEVILGKDFSYMWGTTPYTRVKYTDKKGTKQMLYADSLMMEATKDAIEEVNDFPIKLGALQNKPISELRAALVQKGYANAPHYVVLVGGMTAAFVKNLVDIGVIESSYNPERIFTTYQAVKNAIAALQKFVPKDDGGGGGGDIIPPPPDDNSGNSGSITVWWIVGSLLVYKMFFGKKKG